MIYGSRRRSDASRNTRVWPARPARNASASGTSARDRSRTSPPAAFLRTPIAHDFVGALMAARRARLWRRLSDDVVSRIALDIAQLAPILGRGVRQLRRRRAA